MAEQVASGIHLLDLGWRPPLRSNAFLVNDGEITLVDTGLPVNFPRIRRELRSAGVGVEDVDRVLLSHYDLDHVGGLARLVPDLTAPAYLGRADLELLQGGHDPPVVHHKGLFHRGLRRVHSLPDTIEFRPVDDGDQLGEFSAFHTPGHNPGHVVYVHEGLSAAFLGDLVWEEDGRLTTPIRLDSYDMAEVRESVRRLVESSPRFEIACVAHGTPIREGGYDAMRVLADGFDAASELEAG